MEDKTLEEPRAVYLTAEDLRVAASVLYNAYHDDPIFIAAFEGDKAQYEKKLRAVIREELHELWQQEQALIGLFDKDRLVGVACIVTQQVPLGDSRYWHWRLKMMLSAGWQSTQALINKEKQILAHLPSEQCGILQFIAIAPTEQSKGYGKRLIKAALSWCDEQLNLDGIGVFTSKDEHADLFLNYGFVKLDEISLGKVAGDLLFYRCNEVYDTI